MKPVRGSRKVPSGRLATCFFVLRPTELNAPSTPQPFSPASGRVRLSVSSSGDSPYAHSLRQADSEIAQQRYSEAERVLRDTIALDAAQPKARRKLVVVLLFQNKTTEAQNWLSPLLLAHPTDVNLLFNQAVIWVQLKRADQAGATLQSLLALQPDHLQARVQLANLLLHDPQRAMAVLAPVLSMAADDAALSFMLGSISERLRDPRAAVAHYAQALAVNPSHVEALSNWLFNQHCVLPVPHDNIRDVALKHGQHLSTHFQAQGWVKPRVERQPARPIMRIGILSSDLRDNVVGHFLTSVLEALKHRRVELIAYANHGSRDPQSALMRTSFSRWNDVKQRSDAEVADVIEADQLDVLLDLNGHTSGHRLGVLLRRPAPRQVSWLGYFGTTGMPCIDAVITDPRCVPPDEEAYFSEALLRMPHSRFCLTAPPEAPPIAADPPMANAAVMAFACFQNVSKINGDVLAVWRRVLEAVPASVLHLQSLKFDGSDEVRRLVERLQSAGIDLRRIRTANGKPRADYLAQYNGVDVLLDTFPYPGGTTTAEAIWMGVPTITLATPGMLGRQGQAMLETVGLGDWVAHSEDDYVGMAVALANDRAATVARLRALRSDLRETARLSPLFDAERFAQDLERLLRNFCARTVN